MWRASIKTRLPRTKFVHQRPTRPFQPDTLTTDAFPLSFALNQPGYFEPGKGHAYSNTGYALVGVILERVLNAHPAQAIRNRILAPLGMDSSYVKGIEIDGFRLESGYFINVDDPAFPAPMQTWIDTRNIIGSTATSDAPLAANALDMAKLLKAIVVPNAIISENVRENLIGKTHQIEADGPNFYRGSELYYGLGVWIEVINGQTFYHHGGTEFGYFTQNIYLPEGDVSITAMANCGVNVQCEEGFQDFAFDILNLYLNVH